MRTQCTGRKLRDRHVLRAHQRKEDILLEEASLALHAEFHNEL